MNNMNLPIVLTINNKFSKTIRKFDFKVLQKKSSYQKNWQKKKKKEKAKYKKYVKLRRNHYKNPLVQINLLVVQGENEDQNLLNQSNFRQLIFSPFVTKKIYTKHLMQTKQGYDYSFNCLKSPSPLYIKNKQINLQKRAISSDFLFL